jgi:hypothetical protein
MTVPARISGEDLSDLKVVRGGVHTEVSAGVYRSAPRHRHVGRFGANDRVGGHDRGWPAGLITIDWRQ